MLKNTGVLKSLKNALSGFFFAVKTEANLRFHLSIANLICVFGYFFGLSSLEWAILFITAAAVISAELFNTAIEKAVDTATDKICDTAKHAKDASAAATLILAIMSLAVGVCLFGDIKKIKVALDLLFKVAFSGVIPFLILFSILIFNIRLLFFCGRKKG